MRFGYSRSVIDQALAWMESEGAGYKRAARKFGVEVSELKRARLARRGSRARAPARPKPTKITRAEFDAWLAIDPENAHASPRECFEALRPSEPYEHGNAEYYRIRRYQRGSRGAELPVEKVTPTAPISERRAWALEQLANVEADIANERARPKPTANGIAALLRAAREYRDIIDQDETPADDELDGKSPEEVLEILRAEFDAYPEAWLELALHSYSERVGGQVVLVHDGGRSVLTADGWERG